MMDDDEKYDRMADSNRQKGCIPRAKTPLAVPDGKTDIVGLVLGIIVDQNNL